MTGTDAGDFTIAADGSGRGVLTFSSPPDFENPADSDRDNQYELAVVATDDEGNSDTVDFAVTVTDHNEGVEPTISTRRPPSTYRENGTSTVYTFRASDPQSGDHHQVVVDRDRCRCPCHKRQRGVDLQQPADFESPADLNRDNVYELAVVASDDEATRIGWTSPSP